MFTKFWILLCLSVVNTSAFPGESIIRGLKLNYANFCFGMNKCELVQHALLDHFYVQFLRAETNAEANVKITQVVIYTHIFMLRWKIDQNQQLIEKLRTQKVLLEVPEEYNKGEKRIFTRMELINILMNSPVQFVNGSILPLYSVLCILLVLKNEIFTELGLRLPSPTDELPRCENDNVAEHFIGVNHDQIMEWLLADLLHFLPKRPWFFKEMRQIKESKDIDKILELRWKFYKVFGFAKTSMLSESYFPEFDLLIPDPDENLYFELAYRAFFHSKTVESKWRNKIVLDKILYDEWVVKFFKELYARITQRKKSPITDIWLEDLRSYWRLISQQFWLNGNYLKKHLENLAENSRETPIRMKDLFENSEGKDKPMLLLENGPEDVSLFHALASCTEQYTAIYMKKWQKFSSNFENLVEYSLAMQEKLVECVAKNLRKPYNGKEDEYLAKSHLEKIVNILKEQETEEEQVDGESSEFSHLFIEHKHLWNEILDTNGIEQIDKLLNENYLSAPEELSDSKISEIEDHFTDAEDGEGLENSKVEISHKIPEIDESNPMAEYDFKYGLTLEQVKMRKKLLKEMRNKKTKNVGKEEWKGKHKKFESHKSPSKYLKSEETSSGEVKIEKIGTKSGKSTAYSSPKIGNFIVNQNDNKCRKMLKGMDIHNLADLSDDMFLGLLYQIYMDGQFGDECVEYLHISVLVRAIGIKTGEFDRKDELVGKFAYQWMELISTELDHLEDAKFLMEKLYFVYNELCHLQQSYCISTFEKAIKMLGDRKLTKIGKKSEKIDNDNDPEEFRLTQFGSYKISTLKTLLAQLHLFTFAMLKAKNEEFGENDANLYVQNERFIKSLFGERNLDEKKLNEMVEKMRNLTKEQQIDELKLMEMFGVGEPKK